MCPQLFRRVARLAATWLVLTPNPTIGAGKVGNTQLASDAASLSKVSAGALTANGNNVTVLGTVALGVAPSASGHAATKAYVDTHPALGTTCKALLLANAASTDGWYTIDPDGNGPVLPFQVWCDMSGGGWTRVDQLAYYGFGIHTEAEYTQPYRYNLSVGQINALRAVCSEGKQAYSCQTLGVGNPYFTVGWDNVTDSYAACWDPGNAAYKTSSGSVSTFARIPLQSWRSQDCGDVTEACSHNVDHAWLR